MARATLLALCVAAAGVAMLALPVAAQSCPDPDMGEFPMHHVVPRLSSTPGAIRTPAPRLDEHNRALLARAGVDDAGYAQLLAAGAAYEASEGGPGAKEEEE